MARTLPYQRRRRGPVFAVVSTLAVMASITWTFVFFTSGSATSETCPTPATPAGEVLDSDALDGVPPIPPAAAAVRVLNAGGQRGQASLVAAQLGDLGFPASTEPGTDPLFPEGDMQCYGQLRFGAAGEGAASTLSIVMPCAELVRDGRQDGSVDISVGTAFGDLNPTRDTHDVLDQLAEPTGGSDGAQNADPNADPNAEPRQAGPSVDPALIAQARSATC